VAAQPKEQNLYDNTETPQPRLLAQLEPLLDHRAVLISISKLEDDQLQVSICPLHLKEGENAALTAPLCVTCTAVELDQVWATTRRPQVSSLQNVRW